MDLPTTNAQIDLAHREEAFELTGQPTGFDNEVVRHILRAALLPVAPVFSG
jgi:hypothetical protein